MKCADIMTSNPQMCLPDDKVITAINLMCDHNCSDIPVVKDMESKQLVGMVTDRSIAIYVVKHSDAHPSEVKVMDCMSPVLSCRTEDPVEKAIIILRQNKIRHVPVVDEHDCCVGIISQEYTILNIPTWVWK